MCSAIPGSTCAPGRLSWGRSRSTNALCCQVDVGGTGTVLHVCERLDCEDVQSARLLQGQVPQMRLAST